jgi:hypothetical protein
MNQIYICPKCGYHKWKVSITQIGDSNNKECEKCGYVGAFFLKEKISKSKKTR